MTTKLYPHLVIHNIKSPNRIYAFPFLGIFIRLILLIPVFIWVALLSLIYAFYWLVLPFYILFTGRYWNSAYTFIVGYLKLSTKISLFIFGLTDTYPGFGLNDGKLFEMKIEKPTKSSRLLGAPILGNVIRMVLLIPFLIFEYVLSYGTFVAVFISWFIVFAKGKYPESLYEFVSDYIRVSNASSMYTSYMSDEYPSFSISMKHQTVKILLIIAGAALLFGKHAGFSMHSDNHRQFMKDRAAHHHPYNLD